MAGPKQIKANDLASIYALLAVSFLIISAVVWQWEIAGKWYYCADYVPFEPDFFFLSFAHPKVDASDWYAVDERLVHALWVLMVVVALAVPRLMLRRYFLQQL